MATLESVTAAPWSAGAPVERAWAAPWTAGVPLETIGSPYTPSPGGGGTGEGTGNLAATFRIDAAPHYEQAHTLVVTDLRDSAVLQVDSLTISMDQGSALWSLSARGGADLFARLTGGEQPATVSVVLDGQEWRFIVEQVRRDRAFASSPVSFGGRSLAAAAGAPYQFQQQWISEAPTTAAQVAAGAQAYTDLLVLWGVTDWPIPAGALSFQGSPLAVVQRVAEAIGAQVRAARADYSVEVLPRYATMPNEWNCVAPDVQVHFDAVESEQYERADQPMYNAVYISGQAQGVLAFVRLDGTTGTDLAPLVTDPLITDLEAARQRGEALLGAAGKQVRITRTIPVLTGAGQPGVLDPGMLVRWVDPGETWVGAVRSVSVSVALPVVRQTLGIERHTEFPAGVSVAPDLGPPLAFATPIDDQALTVDDAFSLDVSTAWEDGTAPFTFSMRSGNLPAGLTLDPATGVISGTPTGVGTEAIRIRCTDATFGQADSNEFDLAVSA